MVSKKGLFLLPVILAIIILVPVIFLVYNSNTGPAGREIEESIDLSYGEWDIPAYQLKYTGVFDNGDGVIRISDSNIGGIAKATLNFNPIDIGYIKMDMSAPSPSQNYFGMEFRANALILFKLERITDTFSFEVGTDRIFVVDLETEYQTIEILFDLSDPSKSLVSVDLDGTRIINEIEFESNGELVNNIYMHTLYTIFLSQTYIKFESLYNFV